MPQTQPDPPGERCQHCREPITKCPLSPCPFHGWIHAADGDHACADGVHVAGPAQSEDFGNLDGDPAEDDAPAAELAARPVFTDPLPGGQGVQCVPGAAYPAAGLAALTPAQLAAGDARPGDALAKVDALEKVSAAPAPAGDLFASQPHGTPSKWCEDCPHPDICSPAGRCAATTAPVLPEVADRLNAREAPGYFFGDTMLAAHRQGYEQGKADTLARLRDGAFGQMRAALDAHTAAGNAIRDASYAMPDSEFRALIVAKAAATTALTTAIRATIAEVEAL
jgi:hypothetical protein